MHITVQRQALLEALTRVSTVVPRKTSLPVCATVLLKAKDGKLTITGTNLNETLLGTCRARVEKSGDICTYPDPMLKFLKAIETASVTITAGVRKEAYASSEYKEVEKPDGTKGYENVPTKKHRTVAKFSLVSGDSSINLSALSPKEFPQVPNYTVPTKAVSNLAGALAEVVYAVATEVTRPVLGGICLRPHGGKLDLVAADGFRLARTSIHNPGISKKDIILTREAVAILRRQMGGRLLAGVTTLKKKEGEPEHRVAAFATKEVCMLTRPIEGTFPPYEQLIPKGGKFFRCGLDELKKAVSQVLAIKSANDIIRLRTKGKKLIVSARDDEAEVQHTIPARGRLQIGFNRNYLRDLLPHLDGEFAIRWTDDKSPVLARSNGTTHLVMPMAVNW